MSDQKQHEERDSTVLPPLILLLSASEESLGRALREEEVIAISRALLASRIHPKTRSASWEYRGIEDIDPDNVWAEWQVKRRIFLQNPELAAG